MHAHAGNADILSSEIQQESSRIVGTRNQNEFQTAGSHTCILVAGITLYVN
jgi:hypothetical protein